MNILVIGNGFDIAHDLPTTYTDFLEFANRIVITKTWIGGIDKLKAKRMNDFKAKPYVIKYIEDAFKSREYKSDENTTNKNPLVQEMYDLLEDNVWYDYLQNIYTNAYMRGNNWIDFESEISYVIEVIDRRQENLYTKLDISTAYNDSKVDLFLKLLNFDKYKIQKRTTNIGLTFRDLLDKSYEDLRRLIRCLEIYLSECVEKADVKIKSPDIVDRTIDAIIDFNYTHTFNKVYPEKNVTKIHYIHGETGLTQNNMVLGIDEYRTDEEKDSNTNYNIYKKFTQRIINDTGFMYRDWIAKIDKEYKQVKSNSSEMPLWASKLYVFGHSLDVTDKDVLGEIITEDGVYTIIFYHDKQQQAQQIANLVKMIGQNKFIEMINEVPQRIRFKPQEKMIDI